MKTYKAGELREDMLVVPVHMFEGFALVPVEPTEAMLRATGKITVTAGDNFDYMGRDEAIEAYRAMLAAAPKGDSHE